MRSCFLYFGDNLFDKFTSVSLDLEGALVDPTPGILFDRLSTDDGKCRVPVGAVYPCWHRVFFATERGIYCCGFQDGSVLKHGKLVHAQLEKCDTDFIGDDMNVSTGWKKALISSKGKCLVVREDLKLSSVEDSSFHGNIEQMSLNDKNGFVIDENGAAYTFGLDIQKIEIQLLPGLHNVLEIACGMEHNLILTKAGQVYSFGNSSRGQLGHGQLDSEIKPKLIEAIDGIFITAIAAGGWHSAAISEFGDLYTWGWNESGQLGRPCSDSESVSEAKAMSVVPELLNFNEDIQVKAISLGSRHSAALLGDLTVWTWGWNKYGQLGDPTAPFRDSPSLVHLPSKFKCEGVHCKFWGTLIIGELKE